MQVRLASARLHVYVTYIRAKNLHKLHLGGAGNELGEDEEVTAETLALHLREYLQVPDKQARLPAHFVKKFALEREAKLHVPKKL